MQAWQIWHPELQQKQQKFEKGGNNRWAQTKWTYGHLDTYNDDKDDDDNYFHEGFLTFWSFEDFCMKMNLF